jgi:predicted ribosome quality control (RQC) complex YloA/Tae2 family protein
MKKFLHTIGDIKYTIEVGQNAKENWDLIDNSEPNDLWFHLDEYPSAHVILSQNSSLFEISDYHNQIITIASNYCKTNSKQAKNLYNVKIVYTQVKNLKKAKEVGSVNISKPNYIYI